MALPTNVITELKNWLADITQLWNGKNETGVDFGTHGQIDIPVYSLTSGKVIGSGYYAGGGVVAIQSNINYAGINGPASIYYQHLDQNLVKVGDTITAGQEIGLSGGQLSGGSHPSTRQFSGGPHLEIGINAPYSANGIWANRGPNVNPLGFFQALVSNNTSVLGNGATGGACTNPLDPTCIAINAAGAAAGAAGSVADIASAITNLPNSFGNIVHDAVQSVIGQFENSTGIAGIRDIGWRALLIAIAFVIFVIAVIVLAVDLMPKQDVNINPEQLAALAAME